MNSAPASIHRSILTYGTSPVHDPYDFHPAGTGQIIEFYDYRGPLSPDGVVNAINLASLSAHKRPAENLIDTGQMHFTARDVQLLLYPEEDMTWRMWTNAIFGIRRFVKDKEMFFGWSFIILDRGDHIVGKGLLEDISYSIETSKT